MVFFPFFFHFSIFLFKKTPQKITSPRIRNFRPQHRPAPSSSRSAPRWAGSTRSGSGAGPRPRAAAPRGAGRRWDPPRRARRKRKPALLLLSCLSRSSGRPPRRSGPRSKGGAAAGASPGGRRRWRCPRSAAGSAGGREEMEETEVEVEVEGGSFAGGPCRTSRRS